MTTKDERAAKIAALNDQLRSDPFGGHGHVVMTRGVAHAGTGFFEKVLAVLAALSPEHFEPGNDPYHERDFAVFEVEGVKLYAKIDYYQSGTHYRYGAETPDNPEATDRVMTIMLREEY